MKLAGLSSLAETLRLMRNRLDRRKRINLIRKSSAVFFSSKEKKAWQFMSRREAFYRINYYLRTNRISGPYVEFGCHTATTMRLAIQILGGVTQGSAYPTVEKFLAFDSFEGMPDPSEFSSRWTHLRRGDNATSLEQFLKLCEPRQQDVLAVKGFFSDSLTDPELDRRMFDFLAKPSVSTRTPEGTLPIEPKFACVYVDVDYYESTLQALEFSIPRLEPGGLLVLDDWNLYRADPTRGQRRALDDFLMTAPFVLVPLWHTGWGGRIFSVHPQ